MPVKEEEVKGGVVEVVAETEKDTAKDKDFNEMEVDMDLVEVEKEVVLQETDDGGNSFSSYWG